MINSLSTLSTEELRKIVAEYPYFVAAQKELCNRGVKIKKTFLLSSVLKGNVSPQLKSIDATEITRRTTIDIINTFVQEPDHKIVVNENIVVNVVDSDFVIGDDDGEILTEELAEIYQKQGLLKETIEIYRKLSLLYPKKSSYFAKLIENLEKNN